MAVMQARAVVHGFTGTNSCHKREDAAELSSSFFILFFLACVVRALRLGSGIIVVETTLEPNRHDVHTARPAVARMHAQIGLSFISLA